MTTNEIKLFELYDELNAAQQSKEAAYKNQNGNALVYYSSEVRRLKFKIAKLEA